MAKQVLISVKASHRTVIRRFSVDSTTKFTTLVKKLRKAFPDAPFPLKLEYANARGDRVGLTTKEQWEALMPPLTSGAISPLRLFIRDDDAPRNAILHSLPRCQHPHPLRMTSLTIPSLPRFLSTLRDMLRYARNQTDFEKARLAYRRVAVAASEAARVLGEESGIRHLQRRPVQDWSPSRCASSPSCTGPRFGAPGSPDVAWSRLMPSSIGACAFCGGCCPRHRRTRRRPRRWSIDLSGGDAALMAAAWDHDNECDGHG